MRRAGAFLLGIAALVGCGSDERSAGGSSYETENALSAIVVHPDGSPAVRTLVRARPFAWLVGDSIDSSFNKLTDAQGRVRFELPSGAWRVEAGQGREIALLDVPATGRVADLGTVRLAAPASVYGRTEPGVRIGASGLQTSAVADAAGLFHFDSLPAGVHVLRRIGSNSRAFVQAVAGKSTNAGILRAVTDGQIFLDDFEDEDARLLHGAWTGGGWWWISASSGVHLSPDSADSKPGRAVLADGGGGYVFHFSADFPAQADTSSRASCGVDFGVRRLDLSDLVSVRFRARGIGVVTFIVSSDSAAPSQALRTTAVLDSIWREFEIPASSLRQPSWSATANDSAIRREFLRRSIGLTWSLAASGDLWLDDIRLVGPSPASLWASRPPP